MYYTRLYDLRKEHKLTQDECADMLNLCSHSYGRYERGETDLPMRFAIKLAEYYHVTLDYLVGISDQRTYDLLEEQKETLIEEFKTFINSI